MIQYEKINFIDLHVDEIRQKIINKFGFKLRKLREKAIEQGMTLLSEDEVLEEIAKRRSGFNFSWEGGLSSDKSSVELQHTIRG